jgi:hypothetical protein
MITHRILPTKHTLRNLALSFSSFLGIVHPMPSPYLCSVNKNRDTEHKFIINIKITSIMKVQNFFAYLMAATMVCVTPACSDDDDDTPASQEISGTYSGTMALSVMGQDQGSGEETITIQSISDNTVSVQLSAYGSGHMSLPEMTISGISVSGENGIYTLNETAIDQVVNETTYTGSISGAIAGKEATLTISLKPGAMPMSINCIYVGTRQ